MATNKDKNLIGHDPLAWLGLDTEVIEDTEQASMHEIMIDESQSPETDIECNDECDEFAEHMSENQLLIEENEEYLQNDSSDVDVELDTSCGSDDLVIVADAYMDEELVTDVEHTEIDTEALASNIEDTTVDTSEENNDWEDAMPEQDISPVVDLGATLTIQHVGELHEQLKRCLAMHDEIEINASDVSAIDTANLQLLVALKKDATNLQKQVSIIYPSPRFIESAQLLGLLDILEVTA